MGVIECFARNRVKYCKGNDPVRKTLLFVLCLMMAVACTRKQEEIAYPVFGVDPIDNILILEEQDEALVKWAQLGVKRAVLVHIDPHDSLIPVSSDRIEELRTLTEGKRWEELRAQRGVLFDKSNYIYAAVKLGMIRKIYWIIPYGFFMDIPLAGEKIKRFLKETTTEFNHDEINAMKMEAGCLTGRLSGTDTHICSPRTLPVIEVPVVLSIDTGFFPLYAEESRISKLRALKWFYDYVTFKQKLRVVHANVSYGVSSGYTKPIHRYVGDQLIEGLRKPGVINAGSPPELWRFRDRAENMLSGGESRLVIEYLEKEPFEQFPDDPPLRLLHAAARIRLKKFDEAFHEIEELCTLDRHYCYGFIYLGSQLRDRQENEWRDKFILKARETMHQNEYIKTSIGDM